MSKADGQPLDGCLIPRTFGIAEAPAQAELGRGTLGTLGVPQPALVFSG